MNALLEIRDLHAYYGKSHVLHGVNLRVNPGEIVSLLGRNGVGRSTMVKAAMGQVTATGSVQFKGAEILGLSAFKIAHRGLGYVPENRDIFPSLTVEQNLQLGEKKDTCRAGLWLTCIRCSRVCRNVSTPRLACSLEVSNKCSRCAAP
ncbi:MAG: hypothetical protein RL717_2734 [Pseudomonadota bacterium]